MPPRLISWEELDAWDKEGLWPDDSLDTLELCRLPPEDLDHEFKSLYLVRAECPQNVCHKMRDLLPKFVSACLNADLTGEMIFGVADGKSTDGVSNEDDAVRTRFKMPPEWKLEHATILGCDVSDRCTQEYVRQNAFGQALSDLFHADVAVVGPARIELSFVPVEKSRPSSGRMLIRAKVHASNQDKNIEKPDFICSVKEYKLRVAKPIPSTTVFTDALEAINPAARSVVETKSQLWNFVCEQSDFKKRPEDDKARLEEFITSLFADSTPVEPVDASAWAKEMNNQLGALSKRLGALRRAGEVDKLKEILVHLMRRLACSNPGPDWKWQGYYEIDGSLKVYKRTQGGSTPFPAKELAGRENEVKDRRAKLHSVKEYKELQDRIKRWPCNALAPGALDVPLRSSSGPLSYDEAVSEPPPGTHVPDNSLRLRVRYRCESNGAHASNEVLLPDGWTCGIGCRHDRKIPGKTGETQYPGLKSLLDNRELMETGEGKTVYLPVADRRMGDPTWNALEPALKGVFCILRLDTDRRWGLEIVQKIADQRPCTRIPRMASAPGFGTAGSPACEPGLVFAAVTWRMSWHSSSHRPKVERRLGLERSMVIQLTTTTTLEVLGVGNAARSDAPATQYRGRICGRAEGRVYIVPGKAFAISDLGRKFADMFARDAVRRPSLENGSRCAFTIAADTANATDAGDLSEGEGERSGEVEFTVDAANVTAALDWSFA